MTTSSEDVLLQMSGVRFKKGDGTLYIMNERLAWMAENRDKVAVSHKFQDIKMQKISPEGKPKVQLQVVLYDGNNSTFHFVNRHGASSQIEDRDKVKELLQQLLPNFKRKVDRELEEKNRILSENPGLLQLYKDLVISQVLTSEEFWNTHAKQHTRVALQNQNIGVSGAFLVDIKPQTDGCNGLKYNLNTDIIQSIFKTYPAVKRKHIEHVPSKLSEAEFWTKFFQSHYFHRDRINTGTKDIFTECGKIDDNALKLAVANCAGDVLLDIRTFDDNTLEEGFGGSVSDNTGINSGNIVHQNMIKRFNLHSIMVLNTCFGENNQNPFVPQFDSIDHNSNRKDLKGNNVTTNGVKNGHKRGSSQIDYNNTEQSSTLPSSSSRILQDSSAVTVNSHIQTKSKRARISEKNFYEDLSGNNEAVSAQPIKLNLLKIERYLHGPIPIVNGDNLAFDDVQNLDATQQKIFANTEMWNTRTPLKVLVSANAAVNALGELCPGGALMRGLQEQSLAQMMSPAFEGEYRNLYIALGELLKHFWGSFPPTTLELEERVIHMHESLQRFQLAKIKPFEERAMRELSPLGSSLTLHLNQLLQSAARKFATWQDRRMRQHR